MGQGMCFVFMEGVYAVAGWPGVFGVGGRSSGWDLLPSSPQAEPQALLPAAGELLLPGSLLIFSLRRAKHHLRHLGTSGARGNDFSLAAPQLLQLS